MAQHGRFSAGSMHAHPLTPSSIESHDESSMDRTSFRYTEILFASGLQLKGLPGESRSDPVQIFCPEVRRSSFDSRSPISHLDSVSCWRGLNHKQAEEILIWECVFRKSLEEQIANSVRDLVALLPARDDQTFTITHYVSIDLENLVHRMLIHYYGCKLDQVHDCTWVLAENDLPSFAYNFVCTRDCFIDASSRPCVRVDLLFSLAIPSIVGEIAWQPPNVNFSPLPDAPSPGASFSIHPEWKWPDYGNITGPGFAVYPGNATFSISSRNLSFKTSPEEQVFHAVVPQLRDSTSYVMEATLAAKSTMKFPAGVRFERTSRYNIRVSVANCLQSVKGGGFPPGPSQRRDSMSPEGDVIVSPDRAVCNRGIAGAKRESEGQQFRSTAESKAGHAACTSFTIAEQMDQIAHAGTESDAQRNASPVKRKAPTQLPIRSVFGLKLSQSPSPGFVSNDPPRLSAKRQRVGQSKVLSSTDSKIIGLMYKDDSSDEKAWTDGNMERMRHLSTSCSSEDQDELSSRIFTPSKEPGTWASTSDSKSHTCTISTGATPTRDSAALPLRRNGRVESMLSSLRGRQTCRMDPATRAAAPMCTSNECDGRHFDVEQRTIRRNYEEFVQKSKSGHVEVDSEEEREGREFESFFFSEGSSGSGDGTVSDADADADGLDLGVGSEGME